MKIAFFIEHISNGGAERVLSYLANMFSKHNHYCILVTTLKKENEYPIDKNVVRYITEKNGYHGNQFIARFRRLYRLREILKREDPDYLISFLNSALYHGVITTRGLRTKSIISVRNDPNYDYQSLLSRIIAKLILPLSEGAVFQTKEAQQWFPMRLQKKSTIILNPVGSVFFNTSSNPDGNIVVAVGRLNYQKNFHFLIDSFSVFLTNHSDWVLKIYGDGELREQLNEEIKRKKLENNVYLCGRTNNIASVISKAKIFVLTSDFEGVPNALMEAMAIGLPCISSNCPCGGPKMLIQDGVNGFLYEMRNKIDFLERLKLLADNPNLCNTIGEEAKRRSVSFNEERIYEQWNSYINSL